VTTVQQPRVDEPENSIIIPVLNEEAGIRETIDRIPPAVKATSEILVIDGLSDDETVVEAEKAGAEVFLVERLGKGYAMQIGAELAEGANLVFLDGDGSYPSEDIPRFLTEVQAGVLVVGNVVPFIKSQKTVSEKLKLLYPSFRLTQLVFSRYGIHLEDPLNGMRAITKTDFHRLKLASRGFAIETEMDIKALALGLNVVEVPIQIAPRKGESKFLFNFRSHLKILHLLQSNNNHKT
jgi:glycosyltransferase involved in cell wall biosynthesis